MLPILQKHFLDLLRFSTGISSSQRPFFVSAEVTFRCNLRCGFCNIPDFNPIRQEAETGVMLKRLGECYNLGCRVISFTGGEPLMRQDLGTLAERCQELGYITGMVTNGLLLEKYAGSEWLHRMDTMAVSFLDDETGFNETRGRENAHAIVKKGIEAAVNQGLSPILFCTLTGDTLRFAEKTAIFADSLGIRVYFTLVQRAPREDYDKIDYVSLKVRDTDEAIRRLGEIRREYSCVRFDPDFEMMQANGGFNDHVDCQAARTVVSLKPDGSVCLPCPPKSLLSIPVSDSLAEVWSGEKATEIRRKRGTYAFCRDCQVNCMYVPSLIGHPIRLARWFRNAGK